MHGTARFDHLEQVRHARVQAGLGREQAQHFQLARPLDHTVFDRACHPERPLPRRRRGLPLLQERFYSHLLAGEPVYGLCHGGKGSARDRAERRVAVRSQLIAHSLSRSLVLRADRLCSKVIRARLRRRLGQPD